MNIPYPAATPTPNRFRVGEYYLKSNVMHLSFDAKPRPQLTAEVVDTNGSVVVSQRFRWDGLAGWTTRP